MYIHNTNASTTVRLHIMASSFALIFTVWCVIPLSTTAKQITVLQPATIWIVDPLQKPCCWNIL